MHQPPSQAGPYKTRRFYNPQSPRTNLLAMHTHTLEAIPKSRVFRIEVCETPHDPT